MPKIVISYRRADTAAIAGRIFDHLSKHFGRDSVFMDIDSVPIGIDFVSHLEKVVRDAELVLAVIGPDWLGHRPPGASRISDEGDFVRQEIEVALRNDVLIVPALVEGAVMPAEKDLPENLARIARLNAITIDSGKDFSAHIERLIGGAENLFRRNAEMRGVVEPEVPLVRSPDSGRPPGVEEAQQSLIRNYVYLSATKVALIHAQLPNKRPRGLSRWWKPHGIDVKYDVGEEYERRPYNPSARLLQMTQRVIDHIRTSEPTGTFDQPKRYIVDTLPMRFGVVSDYAAGIAFFGQRFEGNRYIALVGSPQSMIGTANSSEVSEHTGYYYTLKFLNERISRAGEEAGGDPKNTGYHTYLEAAQIALHNVPRFTRNYEFVAQLLHCQDDLVLATPIYVASC